MRQAGAYGIVVDETGRLLVLQATSGRCYLPGGRIEPGESPPEALVREIAEECGCGAEVGEQVASARQLILGGSVDLEASYWRVRLTGSLGASAEHQMLWLGRDEALVKLQREGDRQALRAAA